jgi:uncharacterized MAPEG superfamily protein
LERRCPRRRLARVPLARADAGLAPVAEPAALKVLIDCAWARVGWPARALEERIVTTPLWCLVIVAVLPYLLAFSGGYFKTRQLGKIDNKNPRQQSAQLEGAGARAVAAQANAWEALGLFTAAMVVLHLANPETARGPAAANLSMLFVATRVAHPILYLANIDLARSIVFLVGLVSVVWLLTLA